MLFRNINVESSCAVTRRRFPFSQAEWRQRLPMNSHALIAYVCCLNMWTQKYAQRCVVRWKRAHTTRSKSRVDARTARRLSIASLSFAPSAAVRRRANPFQKRKTGSCSPSVVGSSETPPDESVRPRPTRARPPKNIDLPWFAVDPPTRRRVARYRRTMRRGESPRSELAARASTRRARPVRRRARTLVVVRRRRSELAARTVAADR